MLVSFAQEFRQGFQGGKRRESRTHRVRFAVPGKPGGRIHGLLAIFGTPADGGVRT